jgi:transcription initiation factor TFIIIB Brf1 subunit/transcription initiation factor TFIIB
MTVGNCALCGKVKELRKSHIIPNFVGKRLKKSSGTGFLRDIIYPESRRQDNRSKTRESKSRNLSIAMPELDRMASELNLPRNVKKNAALLYRKALDKDLIRGRSIDAFIAACIYASCRLLKVPRPLKTVSKISKRLHSKVTMTYRLIHKELNLKPAVDGPYKYIPRHHLQRPPI